MSSLLIWTEIPRTTTIPSVLFVSRFSNSESSRMETSLHRQLKMLYSSSMSEQEVTVDGYRIDAVHNGRLVEIQYGSLGAIREKIQNLLQNHDVLVVKPLAARKYLVNKTKCGGPVKSARFSPTRQTFFDLFDDLVHFVDVFPHPRLTIEAVLTEQEEHRVPAQKRRRRSKGYRVEDRKLTSLGKRLHLATVDDLLAMLSPQLPTPFTTADLARTSEVPRWLAQKMAYCLRKTNATRIVGKQGNALLYCGAGELPPKEYKAVEAA